MADTTNLQTLLTNSLDEILSKFSKTISTVPLINIRPPTFSGEKSQDIVEWFDEFEQVTLSVSEEQRKGLLKCAFTKSARAWYKDDLEPKINEMDWPEIRKVILKRYKPNEKEFHIRQLKKLKYSDQGDQDLPSFVDQRVHLARIAYPNMSDNEIIRDTVVSLPESVASYLKLMKNTDELESLEEFKSLVSRFESDIKLTNSEKQPQQFNLAAFQALIEQQIEKQIEARDKANKTEAIAAIKQQQATNSVHTCQCGAQIQCHMIPHNNNIQTNYRDNYRPRRPRYQNYNQRPYQQGEESRPQRRQQNPNGNRDGPPPNPCWNCGGNHWNGDCPNKPSKEQGC